MGTIYRRGSGRTYWIQWCHQGRVFRETTRQGNYDEAKKLLKQKEGASANGAPVVPGMSRTRWEDGIADLDAHYRANGTRVLSEFTYRRKPLDAFFSGRRLCTIGPADADAYTASRKAEGMKASTARRELGTLVKVLRLAYRHGKLARLPVIEKPEEGPARSGFFEAEQYEAVRKHLPPLTCRRRSPSRTPTAGGCSRKS